MTILDVACCLIAYHVTASSPLSVQCGVKVCVVVLHTLAGICFDEHVLLAILTSAG